MLWKCFCSLQWMQTWWNVNTFLNITHCLAKGAVLFAQAVVSVAVHRGTAKCRREMRRVPSCWLSAPVVCLVGVVTTTAKIHPDRYLWYGNLRNCLNHFCVRHWTSPYSLIWVIPAHQLVNYYYYACVNSVTISVVGVPGYRFRGPGSIPGTIRFSEE
jgi:hypothetical protein